MHKWNSSCRHLNHSSTFPDCTEHQCWGEEKQPRLSSWGLKYRGYIKTQLFRSVFHHPWLGTSVCFLKLGSLTLPFPRMHIPYEQGDFKLSTSFRTHLGFPSLCNRTRSVIRSFKRISPVSLSCMPRCNQPSRPDCFLSDKRQTWQSNEINGILVIFTTMQKLLWKSTTEKQHRPVWDLFDGKQERSLETWDCDLHLRPLHWNAHMKIVREPFPTRAKWKKPNKSKPNFWQILHPYQ